MLIPQELQLSLRIPPERVQVIMSFSFRTFDSYENKRLLPKIYCVIFLNSLLQEGYSPLLFGWLFIPFLM